MSTRASDGNRIVASRKDMVNVLAAFYGALRASKRCVDERPHVPQSRGGSVSAFARAEVLNAIKQLKRNACPDGSDVVAEMVLAGGEQLTEAPARH